MLQNGFGVGDTASVEVIGTIWTDGTSVEGVGAMTQAKEDMAERRSTDSMQLQSDRLNWRMWPI
jgi:hypothetical protein